MKQYIFNIILVVVFAIFATYDIYCGRHWESLIWFFGCAWSVSIILIEQNQEKIDKLEEIRKLLKERG